MTTWDSSVPPPPQGPEGALGWLLVALRGPVLALVLGLGLALLMLLRLAERPIFGERRPVTPWITQGVCRLSLAILGIKLTRQGRRMQGPGAVVANHASWLDIFALNAGDRVYFVSKSEVAGWPGIGLLARATGTLFINRDRREAAGQAAEMTRRLAGGQRLLFFPEGTSTDSRRVLPFKTTLFAAFFAPELRERLRVQPVTVIYQAPRGRDARLYGWWGEMEFGTHLLTVMGARRGGRITLVYHPPLSVAAAGDRKTLARACEGQVRAALPGGVASRAEDQPETAPFSA